jgi:uncharacterized membrane protein SirB2
MLATSCLRDKRLRRYDHMPQGYEYFLSGVLAWLFALMAMWGVVVGVYVIIHGRGRSRALRVIIFVLGWVLFVFPLIALLATLLPSGNISSAGPVFALGLLCLVVGAGAMVTYVIALYVRWKRQPGREGARLITLNPGNYFLFVCSAVVCGSSTFATKATGNAQWVAWAVSLLAALIMSGMLIAQRRRAVR